VRVPAAIGQAWRAWWSPDWHKESDSAPLWTQYAVTFVFNTACALLITAVVWGWSRRYDFVQLVTQNFVLSQCIGFCIHIGYTIGKRILGAERIGRFGRLQRVAFYAGTPVVAVYVGYAIGLSLLGVDVVRLVRESPRVPLSILVFSLLMAAFWYRYMANKSRLLSAQAAQERERARALAAEKQALDAQLAALQAQIEPHFLFNTLANVASLIDTAPDKAKHMLSRLIALLRAALDASRAARGTLGQEVDLLQAYLDILAVRMGPRLRYTIDVAPALRELPLPPLLIQPLVENAIKHGLEPKIEGGRVSVEARAEGAALVIVVADDGLGFTPTAGSGVGLDNLRARLAALYGSDARLRIEDAGPGTRVRIEMPRPAAAQVPLRAAA
jgi:hypothetical protein